MRFISPVENKDIVQQCIARYGSSAEHHYYCYRYNTEEPEQEQFIQFDEGYGILGWFDPTCNEWIIFAEVLAPQEHKMRCFTAFLDHVFANGAKKVWVEFETESRKALLKSIREKPEKPYRSNKINYTLTWPVYRMDEWTGEKMEGKDWKDMRYYWNKFFREHKVEFTTADTVPKEELIKLVHTWRKQRTANDRTHYDYFIKAIEGNLQGYTTRVILVDGKLAALTAGFETSKKGYYYSSIGIYDRMIDRIGEIANMDDLIQLKKAGYSFVDFGGGEQSLTDFKKKFKPSSYYDTHAFSIVKR